VKKVDPNDNPTLLGHVEAPVVSLSNRFALYKFSKKKGKYKSMADVPNFVSSLVTIPWMMIQNMAKHHRYQQEHKAKEMSKEEEEERAAT